MELEGYPYVWLIVTFIVVFFLVRMSVGIWASRKVADAADYIVAGRRLPIYMVGASVMATWFAAETLLGASSSGYQYGFQGVIFDPFGAAACLFLSGFFFTRLMRRARYLTIVDFFERRYGSGMTVLASIAQLMTYFVWTGAQLVAAGTIVNALFPSVPVEVGMVLVAIWVTGYTMLGGMLADTLLDFIQMFFTAGGVTLIFVFVLNAVGGWQGLTSIPSTLYNPRPFTLLPDMAGEAGYLGHFGASGWMYWAAAWLAIGLGSVPTQDLFQRSMSARNESTAVWGTYLAGVLYLFFGIMSPLVGIMMFQLNPGLENPDSVLVVAALQYVPPVLTAIFMAALASALMSTSDSSLLAGASVVTQNLFPLFGKKLDAVSEVKWTRIMVFINGLIGVVIAITASVIYELGVVAWTLLLVGLFVPFAFGMYWKKANQWGAAAAFVGGFASWAVLTWVAYHIGLGGESTAMVCSGGDLSRLSDPAIGMDCAFWDAVYIASFPAFFFSIVAMVVVSLLTQKQDVPRPITDIDGNLLDTNPFHYLGLTPLKDALRKLRPEEYDD
ncbi:MAG: sodium:solute symporter family protein [Anaerolineales bacterium]|nr:sodium:solute symporter family protein [Anaerolineales bacterium]MCX7754794.1 sodium:solute symporter family protein [Anaerolineales bacterium]MDW8279089.1 sodium:solute symporter family protein [Anaerolineales bacterium]